MTILIVHIGNFSEAGYLSLAMSVSSTCAAIAAFSVRNYQITDTNEKYSDDNYIGCRILTCLISLLICFFVSLTYNDRYQVLCINLFMMIRVTEAFSDVLQGIEQKFERYDLIGKALFLKGGVLLALFSIVAYYRNLACALLSMSGCSLLIVVIYELKNVVILERRRIRLSIWDQSIKSIIVECAPLVVFNFLLSAENMLSKTAVQRALGTSVLGIYSSIASPTLVVQLFATVAFAPFLPVISKMITNGNSDKLRIAIRKVYVFLITGSFAVCIGATVVGRWGLSLLFGEGILKYYNLFIPIVAVTCLNATIMVLSGILIAFRQIRNMVVGIIVDFAFFLLYLDPLVIHFGANGASYAQVIAFVFYIPWMVILCERELILINNSDSIYQ